MASTDERSFMTVAEVARLCRVHEITVRRHIRQGRLHAVRVGRAIRIKPEEATVEKLAESVRKDHRGNI